MVNKLQIRQYLLDELSVLVRTTETLISKIEPQDKSFRPHESMRTLGELLAHLVQLPSVDLAILKEENEIGIRQLEKELTPKGKEDAIRILRQGYEQLAAYMDQLSDEDFLNKKTKAFYNQEATSQAKWLIEIITHMAHHRAQLFNYLKALGRDVNMFNLY